MYQIAKEKLPELFRKIAQTQELYLPVEACGQVNYAPWSEDAKVDLDTLKTVKSAKDAFFPQSENLYTCYRDGKKISITPEALQEQPFVVFGMKSCDLRGVEVLDKVFLADPVDTFYAARRAHGTIVAMACHEPEDSCFCKAFGIDCANPKADVAIWMTGEVLYWKAQSEKGEVLTELVKDLLAEAADGEEKVEAEKARIHKIAEALPYMQLSLDGWGKDVLEEKFNSPLWESCTAHVWRVAPVPLCARRASAMTLRITIRVTESRDTAAGILACILILR